MKRYLLLRNNRESGPYSARDLKVLGLYPLDLLWIEGESTSWVHPHEVDGLQPAIQNRPANSAKSAAPAYTPVSAGRTQRCAPAPSLPEMPAIRPLPDLRERVADGEPAPVWKRKMVARDYGLLNVFFVFAGLAACALVMKKLVDGTGDTVAVQQAAIALPWPADEAPGTAKIIPASSSPVPAASTAVEKTPLKMIRLTDLRRQMGVTASPYHVGLFGGISHLQLSVSNRSAYKVDRTVLLVSYLKPDGGVVDSARYELPSIKPGSTQTLSVPHASRGVRVNYRIVKIYSQEYRSALKGLAQTS